MMPNDIVGFTHAHTRFAITSHARPDGDSIGSELGLALTLKTLGKAVEVVNADPHPQAYASLPGADRIRLADRLEDDYDAVFVLECNDLDRPALKNLDRYYIINIDHHPRTQPFGSLNWVDASASAVGEMIYHLARALGVPLTPEISTNLYAAILTDTGSFQFSNTRPETFAVASDLVAHGADPSAIAQTVYMSQPLTKIQLLASVLNTLELHPSGKIAWIALSDELLARTGASKHETEGIVNYPLSIEGVLMAAFFRQEAADSYRVSLRSKNEYDIGAVAKQFGGGGHKNAAGLSVEGSLDEVKRKVIRSLERLLETTDTKGL